MLPRLEAEESIRRSNEIAVGTGAVANPRAISDEWERIRRGEAPTSPGPAGRAGPAPTRKPRLFSDEVFSRLPVRRVTTRKG
jgi:hypothetical protein